ncbi:GlxA family transcriptional regulator [Halocynthiibacter styelae]|uniref:GlxA family transcriptional regulator n=1 Tax=Halocynthiibacter styelae TaxID=2761955 RepID=A0A8J7IDX8_9RHOB|nr:GlxA family transcriptional regulator [Paenihalocynthiibacter styelae]MBI1493017.1 GlxA family transcriptional regulator [Paenihalocynthiibacter styelae]
MQKRTNAEIIPGTDVPQKVDVLLFPGFSNHCLANTIEPLRAANTLSRRELYQWRFLTVDGAIVRSSSGLFVEPYATLRDGRGDMLCLMPSYDYQALGLVPLLRQLRESAKRYRVLAGLDTGSWLLAKAGLLEGYKATIHWEELTEFAETFPETDSLRERFVIDRDRISCSGAMAAFDLVMHLIGRDHGPLLALEVAQLFMTQEAARSSEVSPRRRSRTVDRAVFLMQENIEEPLTIAAIAKQVGCTQRTLERHMKTELNARPLLVYRRLRLNLARKLVTDSDLAVAEIALRCGYENPSALTRAFKAEFGEAPRAMRNQ